MEKSKVFRGLSERGFTQFASIETAEIIEYRFSDGLDVIKVFLDVSTGLCNIEA